MLPTDEETRRWDCKEKRRPYTSTQAGRESNIRILTLAKKMKYM